MKAFGLKGTANLACCWLLKSMQEHCAHASWILPMACSEGDSRRVGLAAMVADGWVIERANTNIKWPGDAAVNVATVHMRHRSTMPPTHEELWQMLRAT